MFITSLVVNLKKFYEYLIFPSKQFSKKYSKKFSKKYVEEYVHSRVIKTSPSSSVSLSSCKYAGETPCDYDYNKF